MMNKNDKKQWYKSKSVAKPSALGLRGRQSVRASFRLSEGGIDAISILSAHLGIKQKSIFDYITEDREALIELARDLTNTDRDESQCIQKTFVISRSALSLLDKIADQHHTPRDALVEHSIRKLLPIIADERKEHEKRKELVAELANHFKAGQALLKKARETLNINDPMVMKLNSAMIAYKNTLDAIVSFVEKGKIIEGFQENE